MNQEKVKLIVQNMELLVQSLKQEIEKPVNYNFYEQISPYINQDEVDEYYDDKEDV